MLDEALANDPEVKAAIQSAKRRQWDAGYLDGRPPISPERLRLGASVDATTPGNTSQGPESAKRHRHGDALLGTPLSQGTSTRNDANMMGTYLDSTCVSIPSRQCWHATFPKSPSGSGCGTGRGIL